MAHYVFLKDTKQCEKIIPIFLKVQTEFRAKCQLDESSVIEFHWLYCNSLDPMPTGIVALIASDRAAVKVIMRMITEEKDVTLDAKQIVKSPLQGLCRLLFSSWNTLLPQP